LYDIHLLKKENETDKEYLIRLLQERKYNKDFNYQNVYHLFIGNDSLLSECESRKRIYALKEYLKVNHLQIKRKKSETIRILSLSDLHIPFQLPNLLDLVYEFRNNIDYLVLNGDILDNQSLSSFDKLYRIPILEELNQARTFLYQLIYLLKPKTVVYIHGNHDGARLSRYLSKRLDSDVLSLMPSNVIDLLLDTGFYIKDYQNGRNEFKECLTDTLIDEDVDIINTHNWYYQIGNTIFAHPTRFSSVPLKTVNVANDYFKNKGFDYDSIVIGHTHKTGYFKDGSVHLFEQGCLCDELDYAKSGNMIMSQQTGFVYLEQDILGNLIYKKSKLIII
jgi:predicted phosphodiesterase